MDVLEQLLFRAVEARSGMSGPTGGTPGARGPLELFNTSMNTGAAAGEAGPTCRGYD